MLIRFNLLIIFLVNVSISDCPAFVESREPQPNGLYVQVSLFFGRTNPHFFSNDSTLVHTVKAMMAQMSTSQVARDSVHESCGGPGWPCQVVGFHYWDENLFYGKSYHVFNGYLHCGQSQYDKDLSYDLDIGMYVDSGRILERFLLCYLSQSKIADTILGFDPLSNWIPDSLLAGCSLCSATSLPFLPTFITFSETVSGTYDMLGRSRTTASFRQGATILPPPVLLIEVGKNRRIVKRIAK